MAGSAVWLDVLPSMSKFGATLSKQAGSAAKAAGVTAGKQFSAAMAAGSKGGAGASALVTELEAASKKAQRIVLQERANIARARSAEKAAAETVLAAEARLAEQRKKSGAESSAALRAESQLTTARGRAEAATLKTLAVEDQLKAAYIEKKTVTSQLTAAQAAGVKQSARMQSSFSKLAAAGAPLSAGLGKVGQGIKNIGSNALATVKPLAGLAAGFALVVGAGNVITLGNEYTATMNELQAVTNSTAAQMVDMSAKTRALGKDLTLPATSAKDAAGVMLELAKGGFTAAGAMDAAKGTILLAAAAQVDGAQAAEIQSNAINQFGLAAKDAGTVADVLANTANAASGGITDIATSMKYVGPVAKSLGIDIQDTASSIGLLANSGLKGDTAGTALRGMLASLARPSKQAQKGVDALGLSVFDAQGNFVGMRKVIEQLSAAQKSMTQEQFAANSVLAFGREPLAAVTALASQGTKSYDSMSKAVGRAGGAAAVANSKMQGLGGAMDKLQSQLEDVALGIYQQVTPFLTGAVNGIAGYIDAASSKVQGFLSVAGGLGKLAITGNVSPSITGIDPSVVSGIQTARTVIVAAFADIRTFVVTQLIPSLRNLMVAFGPLAAIVAGAFVAAFRAAAFILANVIGPALLAVTKFLREHQGVVIAVTAVLGYLVLAYKAQQTQLAILEAGGLAKYISSMRISQAVTKAASVAQVGYTTALKVAKAAAFAWVVVTQGMTAAQIAFNVAANANPLGLLVLGIVAVVAAIAALVAGVIYAYKHWTWFRTAVDAVWNAILIGVKAVGAAAVWLWKNVFVPVWNGIVAVAQWAWSNVIKPVFDGISNAVKFVGLVFQLWWQQVTTVLNAIGSVISYVYSSYIDPIFQLIGAIIMKLVVPAFLFLYEHAVKPVFEWIGSVISLWWQGAQIVFNAVVSFIRTTLGAVFTWFYNSVILPVWNGISAAVKFVWQNTLKPVFDDITWIVQKVLAPAFSWLYQNIIKPVFDGIKNTISTVWNTGIKPVFDTIHDWAAVTIPAAFKKFQDAISTAWNAIKDAAKVPIKFVVETVINNGIIGNFNKLADFFGTKKMPEVKLPKGFAGGGVIPGYQSAKRDDVMTPMRKGEGVLVPEVVRALGPGFIHSLNAAGNSGGVAGVRRATGYATGGVVNAAATGIDWIKNAAATAGSVLMDPVGTIGQAVKSLISRIPGAGGAVDLAAGFGQKLLDAAVKAIGALGGGASGPNGKLPANALAPISQFSPGPGVNAAGGYLRIAAARAWTVMESAYKAATGGVIRLTEGYRDLAGQQYRWNLYQHGGNLAAPVGTSVHGLGNAADVANGRSWLAANGPQFGWYPTGLGFKQREPWHFEYRGAGKGYARGGVIGGLTPTLYDEGGVLPRGVSLVQNNLREPEVALPLQTLGSIVAANSGTGNHYEPHFHNEGRDFSERDYLQAQHRMEVMAGNR